jgi:hypothetical protein
MKKSILKTKLVLHRETIRGLVDGEFARVLGAALNENGCTAVSKMVSGCDAALVEREERQK